MAGAHLCRLLCPPAIFPTSSNRMARLHLSKLLAALGNPDLVFENTEARIEKAREILRHAPPALVFYLCFSQSLPAPTAKPRELWRSIISLVRRTFRTRRELLEWLYPEPRQREALAFLRLPTPSKRALVNRLVGRIRRRHKWMSSKLLHAFAFRQDYFIQKPSSTWGALYHRKEIPKGFGRPRVLYVPNRPLRSIQKNILTNFLDQASKELGSFVFGARPGQANPTLSNARRHLRQKYFCSFDLKDFFPSIRVDHIVPALCRIKTPLMTLDPSAVDPSWLVLHKQKERRMMWTHDAAFLVARLCTRRGRLPQGSPTSPALANLAFSQFDHRIVNRLGSDLVYSRYFDDIVVSASNAAVKKYRFRDEKALAEFVRGCLKAELRGSGIRINHKKTKTGNSESGFVITGLWIRGERIDLPRASRRRLRAIVHTLDEGGLLSAAKKSLGSEVIAAIQWCERIHGHLGRERTLSEEKLCVRMLRHLMPDLEITVFSQGDTIESNRNPQPIAGKPLWRTLEAVLSYAWARQIRFRRHDDFVSIRNAEDKELATLTSRRDMKFFDLSPEDAIACTEMFHKLSGWQAYLAAAEVYAEARALASIGRALRRSLEGLQIVGPREEIPPYEPERLISAPGGLPLTREQENQQLAREVVGLRKQYAQYLAPAHASSEFPEQLRRFSSPTRSKEELDLWLESAYILCHQCFAALPPDNQKRQLKDHSLHDLLRILADRATGRRAHEYQIEKEFYKPRDGQETLQNSEFNLRQQYRLLGRMRTTFAESLKLHEERGNIHWKTTLVANPWFEPIDKRLDRAVMEFMEALVPVTSSSQHKRLLQNAVLATVNDDAEELTRPIECHTSEERWNSLFRAGRKMADLVLERVELDLVKECKARFDAEEKKHANIELAVEVLTAGNVALDKYRNLLRTVHLLRCREAHPPTQAQMNDWMKLQKECARILGRIPTWKSNLKDEIAMFGENHLQLKNLEVNDLKLNLIEQLTCFLRDVERFGKALSK